jgi:hypothetical protein
MRKIIILITAFVSLQVLKSSAQTNTFPSSGNAGVGSISPSDRFEVVGSTFNRVAVIATENVQTGIMMQRNQNAGSYNTAWELYTPSSSTDLRLYNGGDRVTFQANGNVGVGTISPSVKFQAVQTTADWTGDFKNYTANAYGLRVDLSGSSGSNAAFQVYTSTGNGMIIKNNGSIGIGTFDPQGYKLAVNGNMIAESVKVKLYANWPDHVFEPSYKLPDLKETEQFIKENKHLPESPSAKEVAENGINLGEMNSKLLQKIEELTLYLIAQDKKFNEQISDLKNEIVQLKSKP